MIYGPNLIHIKHFQTPLHSMMIKNSGGPGRKNKKNYNWENSGVLLFCRAETYNIIDLQPQCKKQKCNCIKEAT